MTGGGLKKRKPSAQAVDFNTLPDPVFKSDLSQPWNILITGIGGTGVVTIGALIGMAAHLENKGGSVLDQTGLAQKGGAVTTHIRIAKTPDDIHAVRIAAGEADLVLGCDMVVVNDYWALSKIRADRSHVVLNDYQAMPGTFTRNPDMQFPAKDIIAAIATGLGGRQPMQVAGTELAAGADGRRHRHQPVDARLRLAAGPGAAVVRIDHARRGTERRRRGDEQKSLRLGPHGRTRHGRGASRGRLRQKPQAADFTGNGLAATEPRLPATANSATAWMKPSRYARNS